MHDQPRDRLVMANNIPMPKAISTAVNGLRSILASISPLAVLRVGGGAYDLVPGSLRLMSHQLAHRFGQTRDVLPEGGQIRGEVSGSAFSVLGHGSLQHEKASDCRT
jgi:hypothetical protein